MARSTDKITPGRSPAVAQKYFGATAKSSHKGKIRVAAPSLTSGRNDDVADNLPRRPQPAVVVARKGEEPADADATLVRVLCLLLERADLILESHPRGGVRLLLESLRTKIFLAVGALPECPPEHAPVFARLALGITLVEVVEGIFFFPLVGGVDRDRVGGERNGEWTCERAAV